MEPQGQWGTWEELVLGSAVRLHGASGGWAAVASEVASRSAFTPSAEECETKFAEVQARYSENWYDELTKKRIDELKREIEKSDKSIGFLLSKIESLSNGESRDGNSECDTSCAESPSCAGKLAEMALPREELFKGSSPVSCFRGNASKFCSLPSPDSATLNAPIKHIPVLECVKLEEVKDNPRECLSCSWGVRKRRNKMKPNHRIAEGSKSRGSKPIISASGPQREESSSGCGMQILMPSNAANGSSPGYENSTANLIKMMKSITKGADTTMLQRQLAKQKRRVIYEAIRQPIDFRKICSKIRRGLISSKEELLRDLLLFISNVAVVFPKGSLEFMSAVVLRDRASQFLQGKQLQRLVKSSASSANSASVGVNKARTSRTSNGGLKKLNASVKVAGNQDAQSKKKNMTDRRTSSGRITNKNEVSPVAKGEGTGGKKRSLQKTLKVGEKRQRKEAEESSKQAKRKS